MRRSHVEVLDEIAVFGLHTLATLAAATLRTVERQRRPFDVAAAGDGDHHVFVGDHVLDGDVAFVFDDFRAATVAVKGLDLDQLVFDHFEQQGVRREDGPHPFDEGHDFAVFLEQLFAFEPGEALEAHVEDGLGLQIGETELADESAFGFFGGAAGADGVDDFVDDVEGLEQAFEDVGAGFGFFEVETHPPDHHRFAVIEEVDQHLLEVQHLRLVVDDRQRVDAEGDLELGLLVERVEQDLGDFAPFELDHHADAAAVGLVAQVGDAFDLFFADQLGDAFDQAGLVDLIGDLLDDDRLTVLADVFDFRPRAYLNGAAAGEVGLLNARTAVDGGGRGEVGTGQDLHQAADGDLGIFDQQQQRIDNLGEVVRRDVGGHTHRDARRTVDQQVRKPRRQHHRLDFAAIVVRLPIDRFFVDVFAQHFLGQAGEPDFGIPHGRGVVAVDRTEVALAVDQQIPQRKFLRHTHDGVVDRGVAMGVVFTHDVADDAGRLFIGATGTVAAFPHAVEHAAVHRFEAVAHVGQSATDDHTHGVVEVAAFQLLFDIDDLAAFRKRLGGPRVFRGRHQGAAAILRW